MTLAAEAGLFTSAFLAATLLPVSSEVVLTGLALGSEIPWGRLWWLATLGNVGGSVVNWLLGRWAVTTLPRWRPGMRQAWLRGQARLQRLGTWSLLLAWVPVIGDPLTVAAGMAKVAFWKFVLLVSLGKGGRYALLLGGLSGWNQLVGRW
ncbi:MAG: DedA family protein [Magnetococcales bacterium]|nr:DedA family protein [Magnetococcales bacterium]